MIPIRDNIPSRTYPIVTIGLIALNGAVFLYEVSLGARLGSFLETFGLVPARYFHLVEVEGSYISRFLPFITSIFLHGGWFHIIGNMWYLWIFGDNVEDRMGHVRYFFFYILCGIAAGLAHLLTNSSSGIPTVGASGSIAGIMGAFMIRRYKTKVRFAYFIWFFLRPYVGVFSIYAGIALPIWFIQQIIGASWSMESGTAYWAHIGGFMFGAAMGASFRFLGIEKKYITPMVEDSFEKLKLSPRMKEANRLLDAGDTNAAILMLLQVVHEERENQDARLVLARLYYEQGNHDDALTMYNKAIEIALRKANSEIIFSIYEEIKEKEWIKGLNEKNLYTLANFLEQNGRYEEALSLFGMYIRIYQSGSVRPKAIYRAHLLFKTKLKDDKMARNALAFLRKEYPNWMPR